MRPAVALAACFTVGGCSSKAFTLSIAADPPAIDGKGQTTTLTVLALDGDGNPGVGQVTITSLAGSLRDGGTRARLEAKGIAQATFSCDLATDPGCVNRVRVIAEWEPEPIRGGGRSVISDDVRVFLGPYGTADTRGCIDDADTSDILTGDGTAGSIGQLGFVARVMSGGLISSGGFYLESTITAVTGDPHTLAKISLNVFNQQGIDVGRVYSATNGSGAPRIEYSVATRNSAGLDMVQCPAGADTGTFRVDKFSATGETDIDGVYAFRCPDAGIDVSGCFHYIFP